jgi:hypothetical protein
MKTTGRIAVFVGLGIAAVLGAGVALGMGDSKVDPPLFYVTDIDDEVTNQQLQDRLDDADITRISDIVVDGNGKTWIVGERLGTVTQFYVTDLNGRTNTGLENSMNSVGGPAKVTHMVKTPGGKTWLIGEY